MPDNNNVLSITAMAVLLGFATIMIGIFGEDFLSDGERLITIILEAIFSWLGINFSRG